MKANTASKYHIEKLSQLPLGDIFKQYLADLTVQNLSPNTLTV